MTETGGNNSTETAQGGSRHVPESPLSKRARGLMQNAAQLHGREYVEPPPRVPRADIERKRREDQLVNNQVYFLYSCNRIKIGTSRDAVRRIITDISPYCPAPMNLIGLIPGGTIVESDLHARFREAEIGNEWFHLSPELRAFICEAPRRADTLEVAEDEYCDWLRYQLAIMDT